MGIDVIQEVQQDEENDEDEKAKDNFLSAENQADPKNKRQQDFTHVIREKCVNAIHE
jgi:hypothetical protein